MLILCREIGLTERLDCELVLSVLIQWWFKSNSKQYKKGDFHTFVCGTPLSVDLQYAQMVADQIGSTHHVVSLTLENVIHERLRDAGRIS